MADQILVNVSCRDIPLFRGVALRDVSLSGGFLYTESPMPVGSMLIVSPVREPELRVAATVALVVEACRGAQRAPGELPGMNLLFEASGARLLDHLEDLGGRAEGSEPAAPVAPAPAPASIAIPRPPSNLPKSAPKVDFDEVPTKVERTFTVQPPPDEPPLQPVASGSLQVASARGPEIAEQPSVIVDEQPAAAPAVAAPAVTEPVADSDPNAPDKVVVEIDAQYDAAGDEGEVDDEGEDEGEAGDGKPEADGAGGGEDKKRKRRGRGRRRKKR